MNDEAAFLAAIAAAPDDEHLPLVFADWLDDQGDPRGQWIRNEFVRPWMGKLYENPIPKILGALTRNYRRKQAKRAAVAIGEPIVPGLIELLKHESMDVRWRAFACLQAVGKRAAAAAPALLALLKDPNDQMRSYAAWTLKAVGVGDTVDTTNLKAALADKSSHVRYAASKLLGTKSKGGKGNVLQELVEQLEDTDPKYREQVIAGLAELGTENVIPYLERALSDPDEGVRSAAVNALGSLARPRRFPQLAIPIVCRAFQDAAETVRYRAATVFSEYGAVFTPAVVETMAPLFADPSPKVRDTVCRYIVYAKELAAPVIPQLLERLRDDDATVRKESLKALTVVAKGDPALTVLIGELNDLEPEYRRLAATAVGAVGCGHPVAQAALVRALDDPDSTVAFAAMTALGRWEKLPATLAPAFLARIADLREKKWSGRELIPVLARLSPIPPEVFEALLALVQVREADYAISALIALSGLGPAAAPALPNLLALLAPGGGPGMGYYGVAPVIKAIVRIGSPGLEQLVEMVATGAIQLGLLHWVCSELREEALPLLPALLTRLDAVNDYARRDIVMTIRHLGTRATAAIPLLLDGLVVWEQFGLRAETIRTIAAFDNAILVPHLPRLAEAAQRFAESPDLCGEFVSLLSRFAPQEKVVRDPLCVLFRAASNPNDKRVGWKGIRQKCVLALFAFNDPALLPDLAALLTDPVPEVRLDAVARFGQFAVPETLPFIRQSLTDEDESVRARAIDALEQRGDTSDEALAALIHAAEDRVPKVRRAAVGALGNLGRDTDAVRETLTAATGDHDKLVAARARVALKKITPAKKRKPAAPKAKGKKKPG